MPRPPSPRADARPSGGTRAHAAIPRLRRRLLIWYQRHRRKLPWRSDSDPYRIWISEVMLQQTQVEVVLPYYERFLARFPDVTTLARAPLASVLQAWAGLGYYARARQLHAAATVLVRDYGGDLRAASASLETLPGIGPYTAGAIRSIAWDEPAPIVDGNVSRVFTRLFALDGAAESLALRARLWGLAAEWAATRSPGDANQALMELGALVCTKARPHCARCPLGSACEARHSGRVQVLPRPRRRAPSARLELAAGLVLHDDRLLLVRRRGGRLLRDWWELPTCLRAGNGIGERAPRERRTAADAPEAAHSLGAALRERLGLRLAAARPLGTVQHGILNHRLAVQLLSCAALASRDAARGARAPTRGSGPARTRRQSSPAGRGRVIANLEWETVDYCWVGARECRRLPLSTLTRKALGAAARQEARWRTFLPVAPPPGVTAPVSATRSPRPSERRSSRHGT